MVKVLECLRKSLAHQKGFTLLLSAVSLISLQWSFNIMRCSRKIGEGLEQNAAESIEVNFPGHGARPLFKGSFLAPKAVLPALGGGGRRGLHSPFPSFSLPPPPPSLLLLLLLAAACLIVL